MGERIWLGTFDVKPGERLAVNADTVEEAAALVQEAAFRQHQAEERLAAEAAERTAEAQFQRALAERIEAQRIATLFNLPDRSGEKFP
jgi:hypothetical protein